MNLSKVKEENVYAVLNHIKNISTGSKKDISDALNLSPATLTNISKSLIKEGMLVELGQVVANNPGRRKTLLRINYNYKYTIGIKIGFKEVHICIIDLNYKLICHETYLDMDYSNPEEFLKNIADETINILAKYNLPHSKILGVGVTISGRVNSLKGTTKCPIGFWEVEVPVIDILSNYLPFEIVIYNDVRALAMYESYFIQNIKKYFFIKYDLGVGGSTVIDSVLPKDLEDSMGVIGHSIIDPDSNTYCPKCKRKGCLESIISTARIIEHIKESFSKEQYPTLFSLANGDKELISIPLLLKSVDKGGINECLLIKKSAKFMAITILNVYSQINPEKIILHGQLFHNATYMNYLKAYFSEFMLTNFNNKIELSLMPPEKEIISPAYVAIEKLFYGK